MGQRDPARDIKDTLTTLWSTAHAAGTVTLNLDDDFTPTAATPALLVADDGGPRVYGGPWLVREDMRLITIRLTAFATGRTTARALINEAADHIIDNKPAGIARIESVSSVLETRDRDTGAFLASVTVPVTVKPQ